MSKKKNEEKIAVVIDDKDICRIVPFKPVDGKYEIKIDFLGNEFDTTCYRLFSSRPIEIEIDGSDQLEVTYHKGENAKPLTIHLKQKVKMDGKHVYTNLPLKRIIAPNINQLFPMPILKLEVPRSASTKAYKQKGYHRLIKPENCNVVEIYLAHAKFDMNEFIEKLPGMHLAFMMLSFEIFTTNSVTTDFQKSCNILVGDEPMCIMTSFTMMDDLQFIAIHYKDGLLDSKRKKINATFIENEFSEAILSMMKVVYPKNSNNGEYDCVYLGAATLKDVNQPTIPIARPSIGNDNVIADALNRNILNEDEKEKLYWHALNLRIQLRDAIIENQKNFEEDRVMLYSKTNRFIKAINAIRENIEMTVLSIDEVKWFSAHFEDYCIDISLMVARYLGLSQCKLYSRLIRVIESGEIRIHAYLQYNDLFDLDPNYAFLSKIIDVNTNEEIFISKAEHHPVLSEYAELSQSFKNAGYEVGQMKQYNFHIKSFAEYFKKDNDLLERIFNKIISAMY